MNTGKTLFAQLMDFCPGVRSTGLSRATTATARYQIMAFAQLTYRESLRDIDACLSAQTAKLYHMGHREPVRRSTLADPAFRCARRMPTKRRDANEAGDWCIYAAFAQRLTAQASVRSGQMPLRRRKPGSGLDQQRPCAGFHDHRFAHVDVPPSPFPVPVYPA
jgi:hypothetical protein